MRYVLDTNIAAAALNGQPRVVQRLNQVLADDETILPAVALAELRYGALGSRRVLENLERIDRLLESLTFAAIDRPVAERFGSIKATLRQRGIGKSDADLLIAATAIELDGILVTNDQPLHDGAITGLLVEDWLASVAP